MEAAEPVREVATASKNRSAERGSITVAARDLDVTYRIHEDRRAGLREFVARGFRPRPYRAIHAIRGVSFNAHRGEVIGVVGANGSGKSSLLRALAGLLPVAGGEVYVTSRPSLLGVGAALRPNLSARRNVEIGCLALGMSRHDIRRRFDELVEFAGVEDFIDLPLRAFSSGMRARLHFAIATSVSPEILMIDEALAVGDQEFRQRSMGRIQELRSNANTVFLVSHNLNEIVSACTRALWLDQGRLMMDDQPKVVVDQYQDK